MKIKYIVAVVILILITALIVMWPEEENNKKAVNTLPSGYMLKKYSIAEVTDVSCVNNEQCKTPFDYLARSNCPYTSICLEQKCTVVCPEFEHR